MVTWLDLGVDDVDLVQFAGLEIIDGIHRNITGALQGGSRGTVMEILHQTGILAEQGTVAYLTDDIEPVVLVGVLPQELEQVLVVSTRCFSEDQRSVPPRIRMLRRGAGDDSFHILHSPEQHIALLQAGGSALWRCPRRLAVVPECRSAPPAS